MKQMLKNAQRILDECSEDHLHPANNRRHPFHRQHWKLLLSLRKKSWRLLIGIDHRKKVRK
jgi:hypothetical protein